MSFVRLQQLLLDISYFISLACSFQNFMYIFSLYILEVLTCMPLKYLFLIGQVICIGMFKGSTLDVLDFSMIC